MDDRRILRFRRRWRDGSTSPMLSAEQVEKISEHLLAEKRKARPPKPAWTMAPWFYRIAALRRIESPQRRTEILREALRAVNNSRGRVLGIFAPIAVFAFTYGFVAPHLQGMWKGALWIGLIAPVFIIQRIFVRREVEAIVARELAESDRL